MSFTLILTEVFDFFQPLKYSINHNVFKIKVKCYFLILSKKRALLFFFAIARSGKSPAYGRGFKPNFSVNLDLLTLNILEIRESYDKLHRLQILPIFFLAFALVNI